MSLTTKFTYLDGSNFDLKILSEEKLILIIFVKNNNSICHLFDIIFQKFHSDIMNQIFVYKVDCERSKNIARTYRIHETPSILFFQKKELIDRVSGVISKNELLSRIQIHI
ncbi:MAG: thioredoxin family protein [Deltaproteobacteria bacterium]|nr:thioredoxin family protein [Deltaproteobacteria bacterium]MBT4641778.1 thioredoxin family protein [Deltaproteobacteria bacterium]